MPDLASLVMAMWLFVHAQFGMGGIPMPVVIEKGQAYEYNQIYSSITVPSNFTGDCYNQKQLLWEMEIYYNGYRNGNRKFSDSKLIKLRDEWQCVQ